MVTDDDEAVLTGALKNELSKYGGLKKALKVLVNY